jgi:hypothetical protein
MEGVRSSKTQFNTCNKYLYLYKISNCTIMWTYKLSARESDKFYMYTIFIHTTKQQLMDIPIDLTTLLECESNNTFTIVRLSSQLIRTGYFLNNTLLFVLFFDNVFNFFFCYIMFSTGINLKILNYFIRDKLQLIKI